MFSVAMQLNNHRRVSLQEATYRLLGMPMKSLSRNVVFAPVYLPSRRSLKVSPSQLEEEGFPNENEFLPKSLQRYLLRPFEIDLNAGLIVTPADPCAGFPQPNEEHVSKWSFMEWLSWLSYDQNGEDSFEKQLKVLRQLWVVPNCQG